MNYQEYKLANAEITSQIAALKNASRSIEEEFISSMQAQGWAYVNTEYTSYGETWGLSPRLLSPSFLAKHGATRETIEGTIEYTKKEHGKDVRYSRYRADDFNIDWDLDWSEEETIFL